MQVSLLTHGTYWNQLSEANLILKGNVLPKNLDAKSNRPPSETYNDSEICPSHKQEVDWKAVQLLRKECYPTPTSVIAKKDKEKGRNPLEGQAKVH